MENIGKKIQMARVSKNLSQHGLAKILGIDQHRMSDIETDKKSPTWNELEIISKETETPIMDLLPSDTFNIHINTIQDNAMNNVRCTIHVDSATLKEIIEKIQNLEDRIKKLEQ